LVELTKACGDDPQTTQSLESSLNVSHRRARETILEAVRISLLGENNRGEEEDPIYTTTQIGAEFLEAVRDEHWRRVSNILQTRSPHYGAFLDAVSELEPTDPDEILEYLETTHEHRRYDFNQTSIDVVGDWGERLGAVQRNAFSGSYYRAIETTIPSKFPFVLLSVFEELEETAGMNLSQRYLSIPELREHTCERMRCMRSAFDEALLTLVNENVGKLELSGAPMDTGAKEAQLGIKRIELADSSGLVSTHQSTDRVMAGVEQFGKQYYYLAIHNEELTFTQKSNHE
jgi:hypothetical protein